MDILIYNDPLIGDNRKFGEIFCDNEGIFTYRCDYCTQLIKHINDVEKHLFTHFKDIFSPKSKRNRFTLEIDVGRELVETVKEEYDDGNHCHISSSKKMKLSCTDSHLCGKALQLQDNLKSCPLLLECDICGKQTKHRKDLKKHMRTTHSDEKVKRKNDDSTIPRCTKIERKSRDERLSIDYKDDQKSTNTSPNARRKKSTKPVINCQLCGREFHCQTYLDKHIENHSFYPTVFECDICHKRVKERKDFIEHMKRAHIGIKYPCKVCGKEFAQSSYVLIHMRMHNQDRGHQCAVCGKTFFTSGALTSHMRKHNNTLNELPCNICGKIFHLPGALRDHVRVHTGEKPFKCDICQSSFRTRKFLNQHKFVHLDIKQFACEICGMKFKQAAGKRVHKRKVHGKLVGTEKRCRTNLDEQLT